MKRSTRLKSFSTNDEDKQMRTLLLVTGFFMALSLLAPQRADAAEYLGQWGCAAATTCETVGKIRTFAQKKAAQELDCWPVWSGCSAVQNTVYEVHLNRMGQGETLHLVWTGKAFFVPTNPAHFIMWTNETLSNDTCQIH